MTSRRHNNKAKNLNSDNGTTDFGPAKGTRHSTALAAAAVVPATSTTQFLELPQECIEKILSYVPFKEICQLRLVCSRVDRICSNMLNTTFHRLQSILFERLKAIKKKMPRRESARRNHHLACESDIIETLHMRLTLLQNILGKHIERKHCCFFPGEILDEVFNILHYIKKTPKLARPYKVTDELYDLSTMAMEYFKEKIEPELPEIVYFSSNFLEFSHGVNSNTTDKYMPIETYPMDLDDTKPNDSSSNEPTVIMRKNVRQIRQTVKRYGSQLTLLRRDLRQCKRKIIEQHKHIADQKQQLAEQQKQLCEFANRFDEDDKKLEELSSKFSVLLQELNKCKTELQYWRPKSPAVLSAGHGIDPLSVTSHCNSCGNVIVNLPLPQLPVAPSTDEQKSIEEDEHQPSTSGMNTTILAPEGIKAVKKRKVLDDETTKNLRKREVLRRNKKMRS